MTQMTPDSFESQLAFHSAPTLLGQKPANLFSLSREKYDIEFHATQFHRYTKDSDLQLCVLCTCNQRALLMLFRRSLMAQQLAEPKRRAVLTQYGYAISWDLEQCLAHLASRISQSNGFPHEIGIFLGYPVADVLGFIQNHGENCKLCGCWKIYDNPEQAQRTFAVYDQCRTFLCGKMANGQSLYQALPNLKGVISA